MCEEVRCAFLRYLLMENSISDTIFKRQITSRTDRLIHVEAEFYNDHSWMTIDSLDRRHLSIRKGCSTNATERDDI